jgi:hypothetical protein
MDIVVDVAAVKRLHGAKVENRQFRRWAVDCGFFLKQAQNDVPHQMLRVGAGLGGELCQLRFLFEREMHFHAPTIREIPASGKLRLAGIEASGHFTPHGRRENLPGKEPEKKRQ